MNTDYSLENGEDGGEKEDEAGGGDEDDDESRTNRMQLKPGKGFGFLEEHFRRLRSPRFGEVHHKRVPTPLKKRRPRNNRFALFFE